jgi:hypothetical protein
LVDFITSELVIKDRSKLGLQMIFHHIVNIFGILVALKLGGLIMKISSATLILEFSNPFLNLKQILSFHKI